jgi:hypothetical protein
MVLCALVATSSALAQTAFAGVWQPGSGAQWWRSGMTLQELKDQDKTYFDKGLRLTDVEVAGGKYLAVWRPGSGAQWWRAGMSLQEFKDQDKVYFDKGLRLTDVEIVGGTYLAVWRPGSGAQWWRAGMSLQELVDQDKTYFKQGLRLTALAIPSGKYLAVWRPGTGAQWWWSGLCQDDFKTEDKTYFDHGLRLVNAELHSNPRAIYRLPFDADSGWKLTNGNWDDPNGGGHGGKPDGLQAFAFDFVHDSNNDGVGEAGQNVRAARSGTVHVVVESESKNSAGSKDLCKDGVGNYIVIKHVRHLLASGPERSARQGRGQSRSRRHHREIGQHGDLLHPAPSFRRAHRLGHELLEVQPERHGASERENPL